MNDEDILYRETHGVIKELDFVNYQNPFDNIEQTEVQHSKYANPKGAKKMGAGGIAKGILKTSFGLMGAVSGGGWAGAHFATEGIGDVIKGAGNHGISTGIIADVLNDIRDSEEMAWKFLDFVRKFRPANGNIGDIVFKDGSCDDFHCGNGHRFFENGDYFEGYFNDGNIKKGLYIWANGQRYLGEFDEQFRMTGLGLTIYENGAYYFGNYVSGLKNGYGLQIYTDGAFFGEWENESRIQGALRLEDGKCFYGYFKNDQPVL